MLRRLLPFLFLLAFGLPALAQSAPESYPVIYLFSSDSCPHCARERQFLTDLQTQNPSYQFRDFEVTRNRENAMLLTLVGQRLNASVAGVPFTVIGDQYLVGFGGSETTGQEIIKLVQRARADHWPDVVAELVAPIPSPSLAPLPSPAAGPAASQTKTVSLPVWGEVDPATVSLPALTVVVALLDGFNPCAMWALIFLISLLLNLPHRRKRWLLGFSFIATSGLVYFLFLSAWLNVFLALGYVAWIRLAVALFALAMGAYQLNDFWVHRSGTCSITANPRREHLIHRLQALVENKGFFLALGGIILLAAVINLVEFACSAGLPAIYTHVLSLSQLPWWQYYSYLALYVAVFILDDIAVFAAAMFTLRLTGLETKYSRYTKLIGGLVMAAIGLLLLFKPEWLMFG